MVLLSERKETHLTGYFTTAVCATIVYLMGFGLGGKNKRTEVPATCANGVLGKSHHTYTVDCTPNATKVPCL